MKAIETHNLHKHYKDVRAVDGISLSFEENRIHGLLGRNGAGKTTLMQLLTGQIFATSGEMKVLGESPVENAAVLSQTCFIQESQRYPDAFRPSDVLKVASSIYPHWDHQYASELVEDFRLPTKRLIKKLSRGQLSSIGIILGLASRAPITFFDEPYMGLDVVARHIFYERLLADFGTHPRTVILSTHHIDEVANLLEHAVVLDEGKVMVDAEAETLQTMAIQLSGRSGQIDGFITGRDVLGHQALGSLATATILARNGDQVAAQEAGLDVAPVSLQDLIVGLTTTKTTPTPAVTGLKE